MTALESRSDPEVPQPARGAGGRRGGYRRWLILLVVLVVCSLLLGQLFGGGGAERRGVSGERVAPYVLDPASLATAADAPVEAFRRTNPPLDLPRAENMARGLTVGRVPLPDDRTIVTYRRADTGEEITQLVLLYDDVSAAEKLDSLAASMVPGWFGLSSEPFAMPGAVDGRLWAAEGYRAVSFRRGGVAVFIGSAGASDHDGVLALAEAVVVRLQSLPTATADATAP